MIAQKLRRPGLTRLVFGTLAALSLLAALATPAAAGAKKGIDPGAAPAVDGGKLGIGSGDELTAASGKVGRGMDSAAPPADQADAGSDRASPKLSL